MKVDPEVITRFLENNETIGDREKIIAWFSSLEAEKDLRDSYKQHWDQMVRTLNAEGYDGSNVLGRIYRRIKLEESPGGNKPGAAVRLINILSRVAAVLFIPLIAFLFYHREDLVDTSGAISFSEIYSPPGTRTMFYLPDGSTGWLNSNSSLRFPTEFKGRKREVTLAGEAYFSVTENPRRRFIVSGPTFQVTALGTEFNVSVFEETGPVAVTLVEGSVEVAGKHQGNMQKLGTLRPGQMCIYDPVMPACRIADVDAGMVSAWKDGKLIFRDESLQKVIEKLNRWYNVDIVLKDKILETHPYRATFEDETLEEVLKLLRLSAPIEYKDLGRKRKEDGSFEKRKIELSYKP